MGGHAFKDLHCPRISPVVYDKVKSQATAALRTIFSHVVVPTEMPCKTDYGDVDFLVSGPLHSASTTINDFDWNGTVNAIRAVLNTIHGRRGYLNPDCMYFAVPAPDADDDYYVQVDVKVCFRPELFEWYTFELNYASNSKMIGSMVKPLGLTIDPEGLHIRVEEIEETNFPGSMIWVSRDAKDVLRIVGLDRRVIDAGFKTKEEIYEYFASSWLFNPAHFAARLAEEKYLDRLEDRAPYWTDFIKEWVPRHYPGYKFVETNTNTTAENTHDTDKQQDDLQIWYKHTRAALTEKVFTMFPRIATEYYIKRAAHLKELEERRLRELITNAIPVGENGWKNDFPQPKISVKHPELNTPPRTPTTTYELTPPLTPTTAIGQDLSTNVFVSKLFSTTNLCFAPATQPWDVPLFLDPLPRQPPLPCTPHPPPANMSSEAKLLCLARWTHFDPSTGTPALLSMPRDKGFEMHWTDAIYAGATDEVLVAWAKEMWWHIWIRQSYVNYVGMWKKRIEKEDKKAEKARADKEATATAEELAKANGENVLARLQTLNASC